MPVRARSRVFHGRDRGLAAAADAPQVVELVVDAVPDHAAVAGDRGRLVDDRGRDRVADVGAVVDFGGETARRAAPGARPPAAAGGECSASDWPERQRDRAGPAVPSETRATSRSRS